MGMDRFFLVKAAMARAGRKAAQYPSSLKLVGRAG
jgi:hypothetical protein